MSERDISLAIKGYENGRTWKEIADRLDVTTKTLRMWVRRFRAMKGVQDVPLTRAQAVDPPVEDPGFALEPDPPEEPTPVSEAPPEPRKPARRPDPAPRGERDPREVWARVLGAIRRLPTTDAARFERWLEPTVGVRLKGRRGLVVRVPTEHHETYLPDRFGPELSQVLGEHGLASVDFEVEEPPG